MNPLVAALAAVLAFLVGIPLFFVGSLTVVATPALVEQIRINPCSIYTSTDASLSIPGAWEGGVGFELPKPGTPRHQSLTSPAQPIPAAVKELYIGAADAYKVPWELLAGIGMAETRHGRNNTTSSAGAQGLMQFMPRTFAAYGVDGNGDGKKNIHNDADSIYSAANYLTASGVTSGTKGVIDALWAYNHSVSYRNDVLYYAWSYATGTITVLGDPTECGLEAGWGDPTAPPVDSARIAQALAWGRTQIGDRYALGANGPDSWDCSSFTQAMWRSVGIPLPRTARAQRSWLAKGNGYRVQPGLERPGDLVFTNTWLGPNVVGHVMTVYNPAKHSSLEARGRGVGYYAYTDFKDHHIYEIWRLKNLTN